MRELFAYYLTKCYSVESAMREEFMNKRKKYLSKIISLLLLGIWFFFIIRLTISGREAIDEYRSKLALFWTVRAAWEKKDKQSWFYLVANIYVFFPLGILLPIAFPKMRKLFNVFVAGLVCSFAIEITQFFFKLGYFEFDDLINNTLGTVMGYALLIVALTLFKKYNPTRLEMIWASGIIIAVMLFFIIATILGQPVFDAMGYYISYYVKNYF